MLLLETDQTAGRGRGEEHMPPGVGDPAGEMGEGNTSVEMCIQTSTNLKTEFHAHL